MNVFSINTVSNATIISNSSSSSTTCLTIYNGLRLPPYYWLIISVLAFTIIQELVVKILTPWLMKRCCNKDKKEIIDGENNEDGAAAAQGSSTTSTPSSSGAVSPASVTIDPEVGSGHSSPPPAIVVTGTLVSNPSPLPPDNIHLEEGKPAKEKGDNSENKNPSAAASLLTMIKGRTPDEQQKHFLMFQLIVAVVYFILAFAGSDRHVLFKQPYSHWIYYQDAYGVILNSTPFNTLISFVFFRFLNFGNQTLRDVSIHGFQFLLFLFAPPFMTHIIPGFLLFLPLVLGYLAAMTIVVVIVGIPVLFDCKNENYYAILQAVIRLFLIVLFSSIYNHVALFYTNNYNWVDAVESEFRMRMQFHCLIDSDLSSINEFLLFFTFF